MPKKVKADKKKQKQRRELEEKTSALPKSFYGKQNKEDDDISQLKIEVATSAPALDVETRLQLEKERNEKLRAQLEDFKNKLLALPPKPPPKKKKNHKLNRHLVGVDLSEPNPPPNEFGDYLCGECDKIFLEYEPLINHLATAHLTITPDTPAKYHHTLTKLIQRVARAASRKQRRHMKSALAEERKALAKARQQLLAPRKKLKYSPSGRELLKIYRKEGRPVDYYDERSPFHPLNRELKEQELRESQRQASAERKKLRAEQAQSEAATETATATDEAPKKKHKKKIKEEPAQY